MPFQIENEVDAEYTEVPPAPAPPVVKLKQDYRSRDVVDLRTDVSANASLELALYEKRARAVTLFLKVPLLTFVALHDKTPALIRLGAGLLALWEASQIYRGAGELEATTREWVA